MNKLLLLLLIPLSLTARADFGIWTFFMADRKVCENLNADYEVNLRFRENATTFHYYYNQVRLTLRPCEPFGVAFAYRDINVLVADSTWAKRPTGIVDLFLHRRIEETSLQLRVRNEMRFYPKDLVLRTRGMITFPRIFMEVRPYITEELFFLEGKRLTQNRLETGLSVQAKEARFFFGYLYRTIEGALGWDEENILTFAARFNF